MQPLDYTAATRTVIVATGVTGRKLEIDGADRLLDRGVFYGAARTEALATRGAAADALSAFIGATRTRRGRRPP